jgi:serine/threonine-protein kinase
MSVSDDEPAPASLHDALIGSDLDGRYTIERVHGRGGMSVVYAGIHRELHRAVAIKVLDGTWAQEPGAVEQFLLEARTASSLSHPNIVAVSDLGSLPDRRPYLVMPMIVGCDLATLLLREGPQSPQRVAKLLKGVASALDLIHARGLVHRDIKSENLMHVTSENGAESVLVLDFGIASARLPHARDDFGWCGTPEFMPPEALAGEEADQRGDVYALATVAFEMITGSLPFECEDLSELLRRKLNEEPRTLAQVSGGEFPGVLEAVVARGLAPLPDERYSSASELIADLGLAAAQMAEHVPMRAAPPQRFARGRTLVGTGSALELIYRRSPPAATAEPAATTNVAPKSAAAKSAAAKSAEVKAKATKRALAAKGSAEVTARRVDSKLGTPSADTVRLPKRGPKAGPDADVAQLPAAPAPLGRDPQDEAATPAAALPPQTVPLDPNAFPTSPEPVRADLAPEASASEALEQALRPAAVTIQAVLSDPSRTQSESTREPTPMMWPLEEDSTRPPPARDTDAALRPYRERRPRVPSWAPYAAAAAVLLLAAAFWRRAPAPTTQSSAASVSPKVESGVALPAATPEPRGSTAIPGAELPVAAAASSPAPKPTADEAAVHMNPVEPPTQALAAAAAPASVRAVVAAPSQTSARAVVAAATQTGARRERAAPNRAPIRASNRETSRPKPEHVAAPMRPAPSERPAKTKTAPEPAAVHANSAGAEALVRSATDAMLRGDVPAAASRFDQAIKADASYAPAWRGKGLLLERSGRTREAVVAFREFLRLSPNSAGAEAIRHRIEALQ